MNAVGIDVSKGKSTVTIRRPGDVVLMPPCDIPHTQSAINDLIAIIQNLDGETKVCMEHTGRYYEPVATWLSDADIFVSAVNPTLIRNFGDDSLRIVIEKEDAAMRISEYLEIGRKMKAARTSAGISQRDMAIKLSLSNSAYSNYENGYSEPPMEVITQFCHIIGITIDELFGMKLSPSLNTEVKTFAEFLAILINLDKRGLPIKGTTTYTPSENQLEAHLTLDIKNAQIATFIPDWNKVNQEFQSGLMDEDEYKMWLEDTLRIFNVPIDDYLY